MNVKKITYSVGETEEERGNPEYDCHNVMIRNFLPNRDVILYDYEAKQLAFEILDQLGITSLEDIY